MTVLKSSRKCDYDTVNTIHTRNTYSISSTFFLPKCVPVFQRTDSKINKNIIHKNHF